jgi:hypothetical protein
MVSRVIVPTSMLLMRLSSAFSSSSRVMAAAYPDDSLRSSSGVLS